MFDGRAQRLKANAETLQQPQQCGRHDGANVRHAIVRRQPADTAHQSQCNMWDQTSRMIRYVKEPCVGVLCFTFSAAKHLRNSITRDFSRPTWRTSLQREPWFVIQQIPYGQSLETHGWGAVREKDEQLRQSLGN